MSWLKVLRNKAGYSQGEVAKYLNMSQSQFSRYEEEASIDDIPYKHLKIFTTLYGFDPENVEDELSAFKGIDLGNPYIEVQRYLADIQRFIDSNADVIVSSLELSEMGTKVSATENLQQLIRKYRQKPNLVFAGHFDAGKTYIANQLLGKDYLPSKRQPATKLLTIVRHISEKPDWQEKPVILLKDEFWSNIDSHQFFMSAFNSKDSFDLYKAGEGQINIHSLEEYGTYWHGEKKSLYAYADEILAHTAVVYIDSPFLLSCNMIDFAGFNDASEDRKEDTLKLVAGLMDVLIYTSSVNGFINGTDLAYIKYFIEVSNARFSQYEKKPNLENIFILCTQASPSIIKEEELKETLHYGCARLYDYLSSGTIEASNYFIGSKYSEDDLQKRFFSFWAQTKNRSEPFWDSLKYYFANIVPKQLIYNLEYEFKLVSSSAIKTIVREVDYYKSLQENSDRLDKKCQFIEQIEPDRKQQIRREAASVIECIRKSKTNTKALFLRNAQLVLEVDNIVEVIESIKTKEEAYKNVPLFISKKLEVEAIKVLKKEYNDSFIPLIEDFNEFYKDIYPTLEQKTVKIIDDDFNSKNGFFDSALKITALIVGSIFSPIFLTVSVGIAYLGLTINRKQWQKKLALQIQETFIKKYVIEKISKGLEEFWDRLEYEFNCRLEQVEEERIKKIEEVKVLEGQRENEIIENKIKHLLAIKNFLKNVEGIFSSV